MRRQPSRRATRSTPSEATETPEAPQRRGGRVLTSAEMNHHALDSLLLANAKKVKRIRMVSIDDWFPLHRDSVVPDQRF